MHPAPNTAFARLVSDLKQSATSRMLILKGSPAERLELAKAIASHLGYGIRHVKNFGSSIPLADQKNSILFFDEADALFGTRTNVKDAHDRYANLANASFGGLIVFGVSTTDGLLPAITQRGKTISVRDHWPPR